MVCYSITEREILSPNERMGDDDDDDFSLGARNHGPREVARGVQWWLMSRYLCMKEREGIYGVLVFPEVEKLSPSDARR